MFEIDILTVGLIEKSRKTIENNTSFYEKLVKEMSYLVRCSPFFHGNFFLLIPQRNGFHGRNEKVIEHLTKSVSLFPTSHKT